MDFINIKIIDGVAYISINRPEVKNALNYQIFEELKIIFDADIDADVVVIQGYEDGASSFFSSGIDLFELSAIKPQEIEQILEFMQQAITSIERCELPVIAKVQSFCFGSALEIALAADFIITDINCQFGMFETKFGIIPDLGGTTRLIRRIGPSRAKRVIYLADSFSADVAFELGIVDWISDDINKELDNLIEKLRSNSIRAISASKSLINSIYNSDLEDNLRMERETQLKLIGGEEVKIRIHNYLKSLKNKE